jgi:hypothetical protein
VDKSSQLVGNVHSRRSNTIEGVQKSLVLVLLWCCDAFVVRWSTFPAGCLPVAKISAPHQWLPMCQKKLFLLLPTAEMRNSCKFWCLYKLLYCQTLHQTTPAWLAQSVERETLRFHLLKKRLIHLKVAGSTPASGFLFFFAFWHVFLMFRGGWVMIVVTWSEVRSFLI